MKKCPHCGQSVQAMGSVCPLCRHDMTSPADSVESPGEYGISGELPESPDRLRELEELWAERSNESLEEAAHNILDYTVAAQSVIREELRRRSIPLPGPEFRNEESGELSEGGGVAIYSHVDFLHVDALQGALKSHGIASEIRNSRSGPLSGRPWPELWILDETQAGQAGRIVEAALSEARQEEPAVAETVEGEREWDIDRGVEADNEPPEGSPLWTCPQCHEDVEGQFSECWNCGSERPGGPAV